MRCNVADICRCEIHAKKNSCLCFIARRQCNELFTAVCMVAVSSSSTTSVVY